MNEDLATVNRRLGDPFAFALLQWPCVVLLLELPEGAGWTVLRVGLALWLAATALAAFSGRGAAAARDGPRFGLWMLICLGLVGLGWAARPGPWLYACLVALPFAFYAAQRAALAGFLAGLQRGGTGPATSDGPGATGARGAGPATVTVGRRQPPCSAARGSW